VEIERKSDNYHAYFLEKIGHTHKFEYWNVIAIFPEKLDCHYFSEKIEDGLCVNILLAFLSFSFFLKSA
jgi:hypothetical protein